MSAEAELSRQAALRVKKLRVLAVLAGQRAAAIGTDAYNRSVRLGELTERYETREASRAARISDPSASDAVRELVGHERRRAAE